jgi:hypothetical protein
MQKPAWTSGKNFFHFERKKSLARQLNRCNRNKSSPTGDSGSSIQQEKQMRNFIHNQVKNSGLIVVVAIALCAIGGGSAVAGNMITGKTVQNNSLTGVDIKNKSINKGDLSASALAGIKGDKGDTGATGATGATGSHGPMLTAFNSLTSVSTSTAYEGVFTGQEITVPEGASKVLITFNAECAVADPAAYRNQYISVRVDGVQIQNIATACSNTMDYNVARFSSISVQRWVDVTPGTHSISVYHAVSNNAATGYLDDKTLTVVTGG